MYEKTSVSDCEKKLKTSIDKGLSNEEAKRRLQLNGKNILLEGKKKNIVGMFWSQLKDPMIYILIVGIVISLILKEIGDSIVIAAVIVLNGVVGTIQEAKAEKALLALKQMTHPMCVVRRSGVLTTIMAEDLVVGDILILENGKKVSGDVRLIETKNMKIEESALTGESVPSIKDANFVCCDNTSLGDRENMAFMSTTVVSGRGEGIVVATGMKTEVGKIAGMIRDEGNGETPLQSKLSDLGKLLGILTICICSIIVLIGCFQNRNLYSMLLSGISLAVAAIPEGLPAVVTIVLSLGVQRMAKLNAITRKLSSVETLGSVNVICSDKTGTLTQNKMTVDKVYVLNKILNAEKVEGCSTLIEGMVLCNDAVVNDGEMIGDPTEVALIEFGRKNGVEKAELEEKCKRVDEMPFDPERKMMSTKHVTEKGTRMYTKGSIDEIIKKTSNVLDGQKKVFMTPEIKKNILEVSRVMSSEGLRVLALACKEEGEFKEENMTFVGMVAMKDPIRLEAVEAIEKLKSAGVVTSMITGDHIETAFSIAKELGIATAKEECINGSELSEMSEQMLIDEVEKYRVFARVSPENKLSIVKALKSRGLIVAMTGDGVNDAPSLKCADVGIAMGVAGTDVAKESSDIVLNDDNFATIGKAVEEGRVIYDNIKKSVLFLLSSNFAEIVAMLLGVIAGFPTPLAAIHVLWVNLITDSIPALALGSDVKRDGVMNEPPRKKSESLFSKGGAALTVLYGALIGVVCIAVFFSVPICELRLVGEKVSFSKITNMLWNDSLVLRKAQTFAFVTLATSELLHVFGMRDVSKSFVRKNMLENKLMNFSFLFGLALQWLVVEVPFMNQVFKTYNMNFWEWVFTVGCAFFVLIAHELLVVLRKK